MRIIIVQYSALVNLGDYNNEKIGLTAEITEDENVDEVVDQLRKKVIELAGLNADRASRIFYDSRSKLEDLNRKIRNATEQWERVAEFLKAQGIKPDAPAMPQLSMLLPEVQVEKVSDGDVEVVDDEAPY